MCKKQLIGKDSIIEKYNKNKINYIIRYYSNRYFKQ